MSKPKLLPSDFYPDYFRTDLGISSKRVAPISKFLDRCLEESFEHLSHQHLAQVSTSLKAPQKLKILTLLGFSSGGLSASQIRQLYKNYPELVAHRGRLSAITKLATLYFCRCEVGKGNNHQIRLATTRSIYLKDTKANLREIFVRLYQLPSDELVKSFLANAKLLLPKGFVVRVLRPVNKPQPTEPNFHLQRPIKLQRGRL